MGSRRNNVRAEESDDVHEEERDGSAGVGTVGAGGGGRGKLGIGVLDLGRKTNWEVHERLKLRERREDEIEAEEEKGEDGREEEGKRKETDGASRELFADDLAESVFGRRNFGFGEAGKDKALDDDNRHRECRRRKKTMKSQEDEEEGWLLLPLL